MYHCWDTPPNTGAFVSLIDASFVSVSVNGGGQCCCWRDLFAAFHKALGSSCLLFDSPFNPLHSSESVSHLSSVRGVASSLRKGEEQKERQRETNICIHSFTPLMERLSSLSLALDKGMGDISHLFSEEGVCFFFLGIIPCTCSGIEIEGKCGHVINNINFVYTFLFVPKTVGKSSCDRF